MNPTVNIALVGICGYGGSYLNALLDRPEGDDGVRLAGVVDPGAARSPRLGDLRRRGIPVHPDLPALYGTAGPIDLTIISTPIHLHASQTRMALAGASNVLCEKPLSATVEDAISVVTAERRSGRFVAVGFQWSFSAAVQQLKRDVLAGVLGRPRRLSTLVVFPRGEKYYRRNRWAGRDHADDGTPVFDSPLNNATAHYLHNMLYLLGPAREAAACPAWMAAECYRANEIESYDTVALRCGMPCGAELLFYATHAAPERVGPVCRFEFEHAVVEYHHGDGGRFVARFRDGRTRDYGPPDADRPQKIWQSVEAVRTGAAVACGARAALPHALCVAAARMSSGEITGFPEGLRREAIVAGDSLRWIDGLSDALARSYAAGTLPSEERHPWARAGQRVELKSIAGGDEVFKLLSQAT